MRWRTFAARTFVPERAVTTLVRAQPMSQLIFAAAALLLVFLTLRAVAWALTAAADDAWNPLCGAVPYARSASDRRGGRLRRCRIDSLVG